MRGHEVHCGHHPEFTDTCTECQAARQAWMNAPLGRDPMFIGYTTAALTEMRVTALATAPLPHEHSTLYKDLAERIEREIVRRHPTFAADLQGDSLGVIERDEYARLNRETLDAKIRELRAEGYDVIARRERDKALNERDDARDALQGAVEAIKALTARVSTEQDDAREVAYARGYRAAVSDALEALVRGQ